MLSSSEQELGGAADPNNGNRLNQASQEVDMLR